ncbi:helix-turn-helix domain-containing protein [Conexibacter stalactiti]|uniref:Helix-turn-helix domain-containing protein n=1 Tax=Conexibacter stalactiti TaxID=1940611 RepID=A0ABU4HM14_9ACTN|nr:helix-turn-helix domain-containing protein [Conexibacter stalactiti]MDW5594341.1 helix-turn-helix domain-containing protein [Conexibacter stalactiti]MEC5034983.1 helix-turn-helix domain-containing protein [Conexibacter stalactiti]
MASSEILRPWHELPPGVVDVLRPELPGVAREIIDAVRVEVPPYARGLTGPFGRGLVAGVEQALRQFVDGIEAGGRMPRARVYVDLGRGEMRAGRSLDTLLSAYRVGARVAWRRFAALGAEAGLPPATLFELAESIFVYIDELSAKSAEGYALEQSAAAGERSARRQRLVRLLVRDPPADPIDVEDVAREAEWRLPETVAVLALPEEERARVVPRLPADAIVEQVGEVVVAIVPDPLRSDRRQQLDRAVGVRHHAALGPAVSWRDAALSLARARAVLALVAEGTIEPRGVVRAEDHAAALLLRSDRRLAQELVRARLAPLEALPDSTRARLTETLGAWLEAQGRLQVVAERLHVHPQTARYRLGQLRELFGPSLEEPSARFELELALRAEGLL